MIASIKGEVIFKGNDCLVVMNNDIGLRVNVPTTLIYSVEINQPINLYTHLIMREDNLSLYGFEKEEERDLFTLLIKVNGIGPRMALSIISSLPAATIYQAIINEKAEVFNHVPGIGYKTAQKLVLYLHDKLKKEYPFENLTGEVPSMEIELMDALTSLGYSSAEAQAAIQSIPKKTASNIEESLRLALQYFAS